MRFSVLLVLVMLGEVVAADELDPQYVYPAGGRQGGEFEIEVGGGVSNLAVAEISGEGVRVSLLGPLRSADYAREAAGGLEAKWKKGKAAPKAVAREVPNLCRFRVAVDKEAAPGLRLLRVGTASRLGEPLPFEISALPEISEGLTNRASETVLSGLPACLNGRVCGTGADVYRFQAAKGQSLVAFAEARVMVSGEFRPVLAFTDAAGRPCEGVRRLGGGAAPVAVFEVPQDGAYALRVSGADGQEAARFVYRIRLGELPLVTGFAPRGAREGESLNVRLSGYNLSQKRVRLFTGGKSGELCLAALAGDALVLPGLRFDLSEEAEADEKEPNDAAGQGQPLALPCVVNGDLGGGSGRDLYRFVCGKGETLYVDVRAETLGSPLKPRVTVRNAKGETVASGVCDNGAGVRPALCGRDPSVAVRVPEDGWYEVEVADAEGRTGEELAYRLRVGPPRPDFRLWLSPASLSIPREGSGLLTVHVQRLHGFEGEIHVGLDFPPLSVACQGGAIPAGEEVWQMTVSTDGARYPKAQFGLALSGTAQIGGRQVVRPLVPVTLRNGLAGAVEGRAGGDFAAKVSPYLAALRIDPLGGGGPVDPKLTLPVAFKEPVRLDAREPVCLDLFGSLPASELEGRYEPTVVWPRQGIVVAGVKAARKREKASLFIKADPAVLRRGQAGTFILGFVARGDTNRVVVAVTQSVPFVIR